MPATRDLNFEWVGRNLIVVGDDRVRLCTPPAGDNATTPGLDRNRD
jgi:hypothetical protein